MYKKIVHGKNGLLVLLSAVFLIACGSETVQTVEKPLRPVRTIEVSTNDNSLTHEFSAVVDASRKADLSFKVSGEVVQFLVNQGERVEKGQLIAKLNDRDIKIQLDEAQSYFDKAKADFERAKNLIQSNTISQADYDQLKSQFSSAKAKLEASKNNLEYTELTASFSGVIAKKYTENFQDVKAGSPIVALHDLSKINLNIDLPESIMIRVKRSEGPPKLSATFEAIKNKVFPLTFKEVSTQADEVTKTYKVTLTMDSTDEHTFLPGMTAKVKAQHKGDISGKYYLPISTVLKDSTSHFVYLVQQKSEGVGVIQRKNVTVGEITEFGIEIFSGISIGEHVLSAGMSKVSDGQEVKYQRQSK